MAGPDDLADLRDLIRQQFDQFLAESISDQDLRVLRAKGYTTALFIQRLADHVKREDLGLSRAIVLYLTEGKDSGNL